MSDEYDYLFKCIVVGDGGCGKTAIVVRFSQGFFQEQYKLTIGVEFAVKTIELINEKKVKLQIWDTGGQERFQYVRPLYYRGSMGAIILFDLTNKESFEHIAKWMEEVRTNAGDIPLLLVGNKSDLVAERQISRAEAEDFAKEFEMYYLESSAKDGTGIGDVFAILSCLMIGIDVPAKYIGGSTGLVDKSGQKMGSPGSIPPPISSPIPQPVSQPNVNFFDTNNRKDINIPKPISSSLPPAFSGDLPDEDLTPQFTNNIPPPQPVSRPIEQDYNISALPIQPKTEPRIPEPIPEPEEWAIPEVPIPKSSFQKVESQESYTLPSQDEIDASIPIVPKKSPIKPATAVQGPITFDDDSFSEPTKIEQDTAPPPLVFDIPEDNSSPKIEFESDSPPIPQKPAKPSFPKAKPAAPPSGFKPKPAAPPAGFKPKPSSLFGKPETVKKSPQAPKSIPFGGAMFQTGTQQEEKTEAGSINSLLGALGTKPTTKATTPAPEKRQSFMSFSGNSSQKQEKKSFFVPEVKEKSEPQPIKIIQPTIANQFEKPKVIPEKKKDKKDKKKGKKDKKDRKAKKDKKNQKGITVCPSCGSILSGKYKFCNKCGSKL